MLRRCLLPLQQYTAPKRCTPGICTFQEEDHGDDCWEKELLPQDVSLLAKLRSKFNYIQVLEVATGASHPLAGARLLLLDRSGNVHSLYNPSHPLLTHSYFDVFSTLPPLIPPGPIGIFGLGAGTTARSLLHFWPGLEIHGWELDQAVIDTARKYFHLVELENSTEQLCPVNKGKLEVHIGNALSSNAVVPGGFAGLFVDLFVYGAPISSLQNPTMWENFKQRMLAEGRMMVNCGGPCVDSEHSWRQVERTLNAMRRAFPGELSKIDLKKQGGNTLALTGPMPDPSRWRDALPAILRKNILDWVPVF